MHLCFSLGVRKWNPTAKMQLNWHIFCIICISHIHFWMALATLSTPFCSSLQRKLHKKKLAVLHSGLQYVHWNKSGMFCICKNSCWLYSFSYSFVWPSDVAMYVARGQNWAIFCTCAHLISHRNSHRVSSLLLSLINTQTQMQQAGSYLPPAAPVLSFKIKCRNVWIRGKHTDRSLKRNTTRCVYSVSHSVSYR